MRNKYKYDIKEIKKVRVKRNMKSGYYIYNNEKYIFELEDDLMTVTEENKINIENFLSMINGNYEKEKSIQILRVKMFPNWNDAIIFHRENLEYIGGIYEFKIIGLIEFVNKEERIDGINFFSKELDYMYDLSKALDKFTYKTNGEVDISYKSFEETNTMKKLLKIDGKDIKYSFSINRNFSSNLPNNYVQTETLLRYEYDNLSENYVLIYNLANITHRFISYLYYRQNTNFDRIVLLKKENEKYFKVAEMTMLLKDCVNDKKYLQKYHINYDNIKNIDDKILQAIIDNQLFIRHIPNNEKDRNIITPQSFVMVSSAFEWEFNQLFQEGVKHSQNREKNIEEIKNRLSEALSEKRYDKFLKEIIKNIGKDNLESKLIFANKELKNESEIFLKYLLELNNIENTNSIFTELQKLRNDFAHGNLEINLELKGLVGMIYLERIVYIMQLKRLGLDEKNIKIAINDLFGLGLEV